MKKNNKPVMIVALVLVVLIAAPVVIFAILKKNSVIDEDSVGLFNKKDPAVELEAKLLSEKAAQLVRRDLGNALRDEAVSIDFVAIVRENLKKADRSFAAKKYKTALNEYKAIIEMAEDKLNTIKFSKPARKLKDSVYEALEETAHLKPLFENAYDEAVDQYNAGLQAYEMSNFEESVNEFEAANDALEDLKKRAVQQVKAQTEAAEKALAEFDLALARASFEKVLEIESANAKAKEGLAQVAALEEIAAELKPINDLREAGNDEEALIKLEALLREKPDSKPLLEERKNIQAAILESKRNALIEKAEVAELKGNLSASISALEEANALQSSADVSRKIKDLKAQEKALRLKTLLETGYNALKAGSFDAAKSAYEEALAIDPESEEARTGLEKASTLRIANVSYSQNIEAVNKYLDEGRIPLATELFNKALKSRPSNLSFGQREEEERIRDILEANRQKVAVSIVSDDKTYVSLIGVFAPEQFKEKEVLLYPDVYTIKGTRRDHLPVELEVKVSKSLSPQTIEVICEDKL